MTTRATLLAVLCALVAASGCGDESGPPSSKLTKTTTPTPADPTPVAELDPNDKRGVALACIRDKKGITAEAVGEKGIKLGTAHDGPRIDFFQSSLEAEGEQFEGRAEGAEQIGAALLYVRETPESDLIEIEDCLDDQ